MQFGFLLLYHFVWHWRYDSFISFFFSSTSAIMTAISKVIYKHPFPYNHGFLGFLPNFRQKQTSVCQHNKDLKSPLTFTYHEYLFSMYKSILFLAGKEGIIFSTFMEFVIKYSRHWFCFDFYYKFITLVMMFFTFSFQIKVIPNDAYTWLIPSHVDFDVSPALMLLLFLQQLN